MTRMILAAMAAVLLGGCATVHEQWTATGGSRADATVQLSYERGEMQTVHLDDAQGQAVAVSRCKVWGYTGAEAFGGVVERCNKPGGLSGCARYFVTREYQCTGLGNKESAGEE